MQWNAVGQTETDGSAHPCPPPFARTLSLNFPYFFRSRPRPPSCSCSSPRPSSRPRPRPSSRPHPPSCSHPTHILTIIVNLLKYFFSSQNLVNAASTGARLD